MAAPGEVGGKRLRRQPFAACLHLWLTNRMNISLAKYEVAMYGVQSPHLGTKPRLCHIPHAVWWEAKQHCAHQ